MLAKLLAIPFLGIWILAGVVGVVILILLVHVRRLERDEQLPYRTKAPRAAGLKGKGVRLR